MGLPVFMFVTRVIHPPSFSPEPQQVPIPPRNKWFPRTWALVGHFHDLKHLLPFRRYWIYCLWSTNQLSLHNRTKPHLFRIVLRFQLEHSLAWLKLEQRKSLVFLEKCPKFTVDVHSILVVSRRKVYSRMYNILWPRPQSITPQLCAKARV